MTILSLPYQFEMGFPGGTSGKEPTCQHKMWEMQVRSLGQEDSLEEGMATHSSILAWRIPWTEEPGRLQSIESQRVRHDWSNFSSTNLNFNSFPCLIALARISNTMLNRSENRNPCLLKFSGMLSGFHCWV